MSDKDKKMLIGVGVSAAIVLLYIFVYSPMADSIVKIKNNIEISKQKLSKFQAVVRQKNKVERQYWAIQEQMKFLKSMLPTSSEIPSMLIQIQNLVKESGVKMPEHLNPGRIIVQDLYDIKPISMNIACNQITLSKFLYSVETSKRLLDIPHLSISSDREGHLNVGLDIYTFILREDTDKKK